MLACFDDVFIGVYRIVSKSDGNSPDEITFGSAVSAIFGMLFFQILLVAGFILLLGEKIQFFKTSVDGVIFIVFLFAINYILFLYKKRYGLIIEKYLLDIDSRKKKVKFRTNVFIGVSVVQFITLVVVTIFTMP